MGGGGGGKIAHGHDRVSAVTEETAHIAFIHPNVEHMATAFFAAADVGFLRSPGQPGDDVTDEILNPGNSLHEGVKKTRRLFAGGRVDWEGT
jgi:hypothetical protein